jgi:5-methylcytosine-specific restriction endonuclease McrA
MIINEKCKCGKDLVLTETPNLVHYGRLDCPEHGFIKWVKNPEKPKYRTETTARSIDLSKCRICGRKKDELGIKETITVHHLEPLEEGGKNHVENLIAVCTACHRLIHWTRLYLGKHLKERKDNESQLE